MLNRAKQKKNLDWGGAGCRGQNQNQREMSYFKMSARNDPKLSPKNPPKNLPKSSQIGRAKMGRGIFGPAKMGRGIKTKKNNI